MVLKFKTDNMKSSIKQAEIVSEYWLDDDTYFVCTDEFKLGADWDENVHGVAWAELWCDEGNSIHFGVNIYEDDGQFSGDYLDTLYEGDDMFIPFPDELKKAMIEKLNVKKC